MFYHSHLILCRRWYYGEYAVHNFLRGTTVFFAYIYMLEKWDDFFHRKKQVQGADSNSKAGASYSEQNTEE
jgi:hypothetical protein